MGPASFDGERSTRPIAALDLIGIAEALGDNSYEHGWWFDPTTGQVEMVPSDSYLIDTDEQDDPSERGLVPIEPIGSRQAYRDMVDFAQSIAGVRARDRLLGALGGRGAFRRFRDTLHDFPDLRDRWFEYSNLAAERRAIEWLLDEGHVGPDDADAEHADRSAAMDAVLAEIGAPAIDQVDETELSARWREITDLIDAGRTVTVIRGGRPWATITSAGWSSRGGR